MKVRVTIDLPDDLHAILLQIAKSENTTIQAVIINALERRFRPMAAANGPAPAKIENMPMATTDETQ